MNVKKVIASVVLSVSLVAFGAANYVMDSSAVAHAYHNSYDIYDDNYDSFYDSYGY